MIAPWVREALVSAMIQLLLEQVVSNFHDYFKNRKLSVSLLEELDTTLLTLQVVLDDAEQKQIVNPAVKQWLHKLKDAISDAKELLLQITSNSLPHNVESTEAQTITSQVWNLLLSPFRHTYGENIINQVWNFLSSPFSNGNREINSLMKNMCERLQQFAQQKDILALQIVSGRVSGRTPSSSMVRKSLMVGRKIAKKSNGLPIVAKTLGGLSKMASSKILKASKKRKRDVKGKGVVHVQI